LKTRSGLRKYTLVMMFAGTGARSGELRYLKVGDLKLEERMLILPDEG
jgi:integrase